MPDRRSAATWPAAMLPGLLLAALLATATGAQNASATGPEVVEMTVVESR